MHERVLKVPVVLSGWSSEEGEYLFIYLVSLGPHPMPYGGSQARGPVGAAAAGLYHGHNNARSKPCLRPTPQLMAMPDPSPTERGQGWNLHPHGC